jgi:AraC-like DNA-binding protein
MSSFGKRVRTIGLAAGYKGRQLVRTGATLVCPAVLSLCREERVPHVQRTGVAERILQTLGQEVPDTLLGAFRYCIEHTGRPVSVQEVAEACGIRRRALEYRFHKLGLPPPWTCLAKCRLLLAVHRLEQRTDSIEQVALECGYGTAGALRKSLRRHLGLTPLSARRIGAFDAATASVLEGVRRGGFAPRGQGHHGVRTVTARMPGTS